MHVVHFFSLLEQHAVRPYCAEWREGDTWTTLASDTTCPKCSLLLAMIDLELAQRTDRIDPTVK